MVLTFHKFELQHFKEYSFWYQDPELNQALGPLDQEWLDCVIRETDGCQYAVIESSELVAVVGFKLPITQHATYTITDLAVKPALRGQGIGSRVITDLIKVHACKPDESWSCFVDKKNPRAKSFFQKLGWVCLSETPNENGMIEMICS